MRLPTDSKKRIFDIMIPCVTKSYWITLQVPFTADSPWCVSLENNVTDTSNTSNTEYSHSWYPSHCSFTNGRWRYSGLVVHRGRDMSSARLFQWHMSPTRRRGLSTRGNPDLHMDHKPATTATGGRAKKAGVSVKLWLAGIYFWCMPFL